MILIFLSGENNKKKLVFSAAMCYNRIMTVIVYFFGKNQRVDGEIRRKLLK